MLLSSFSGSKYEAGVDEAGRGCYAGSVFAAAVILPVDFEEPSINDSKKLNEKDRYILRETILKAALAWAVAEVDHHTIDKINILQASILAMHNAIVSLSIQPEYIIVDGNKFNPFGSIPHTCVVKGDGKYLSIAAASILAKTFRDDRMKQLHESYPMYGWDKNKGYGTEKHRKAIEKFGLSPYHRLSFNIVPKQLKFF